VGSVFSPYYAWARRSTRPPQVVDPEHYCCLNVALYSKAAPRWSMTERGASHCHRTADRFVIGPSHLEWDGQTLHIHINETAVPWPRPIKGRVSVFPTQLFDFSTPLDAQARHHWGPIAPHARVEVQLQQPQQSWSGQGYLDSNEGTEPIDLPFKEWDWSRSVMQDGSVAVLYDVQPHQGADHLLALKFCPDGQVRAFDAPPRQTLPRTAWGMARRMRSEGAVKVQHQLEDAPFYQRSVIQSRLLGEPVVSFHETLHTGRLVSPVVQAMLPFRMPRRS
jgi:carotenoid 1,2-hydratase